MAGRTRSSSSSPTAHIKEDDAANFTYESILGAPGSSGDGNNGQEEDAKAKASEALTHRLTEFRRWLSDEAGVSVHPSICVVNGEATDGTKNAPVLAFGPPPGNQNALKKKQSLGDGRVGLVDGAGDRALYDLTVGCQVRTAREIKKDEVMMTMPRSAMVTPDLIASSDAGRAILACCQLPEKSEANFWDAFENTTLCEQKFKVQRNTGTQLLVKILQERKRAETAYAKGMQKVEQSTDGERSLGKEYSLAAPGTISTRAVALAFLIHQRFSDNPKPAVASNDPDSVNEFRNAKESGDGNALSCAKEIVKPVGSPETFAPYARTLPSSVSLPLSWKRNELALLAGCHPGIAPLQEIAARTLQLASEFVALLEAGILHRFPATFPKGLITWERWVWAAVVLQSRILPATCYLNDGETNANQHVAKNKIEFQSPPDVWNELGVMVPLLDMVNHEVEAHQVTWQPCVPSTSLDETNREDGAKKDYNAMDTEDVGSRKKLPHPPRAIVHNRVRKGSQIYCSYGNLSNYHLILQYGFAQLSNPLDQVRLGWGLSDAVGNVETPTDYESPFKENISDAIKGSLVFDTMDTEATTKWWTDERLALLEREAFKSVKESFTLLLKAGKKMMADASSDGTYHPILLTVAVVGTMPAEDVKRNLEREPDQKDEGIELTRLHQKILRSYLTYIFTRKLEKLLQNLNNGLKAHYATLNLWTRATEGGIRYTAQEEEGVEPQHTGWQTFFDANAYITSLEVEKRYYAIGPDSCVLTLFDGQLRSLQASIDGLSTRRNFEESVLKQLEDLNFKISRECDASDEDQMVPEETNEVVEDQKEENCMMGSDKETAEMANGEPKQGELSGEMEGQNEKDGKQKEKDRGKDGKLTGGNENQKKKEDGKKSPSKSSRRRNKRKNQQANSNNMHSGRPPAIKLHIGNLAYSTTPSTLYDFFATLCGRENVLECHIPTERDTGRSRGFGFVTLPEPVARNILKSGKKHEVDSRPLKIAESNSAGSGKNARPPSMPPPIASGERCANCGYRPKYCVCRVPNIPGFGTPPPLPPPHMHPGPPMEMSREYDYYAGGGKFRDDRFSHSTSPYDCPPPSRLDERGRPFPPRDIDPRGDAWAYQYERSRSRSYGRGEDRSRGQSRRERKRSRSRSRSPRARRRERDDRRWGHRRSSSRSPSYSTGSSRSRSPVGKRSYDPATVPRKEKKADDVAIKEHSEEARGVNTQSGKPPRENRKRSRSRSGRKKKKKRRSARSRSRSRSPESPHGG